MKAMLLCLGLVVACPAWAQSRVVLRGRQPAAEAVAVSEQGVTVSRAGGGTGVVSWDRVAEVQGDLAGDAGAFREVAEMMWRARTRLERGDGLGAEPLFEVLASRYAGQRGASAGVAHGGLLRCRLMAGAQTGAAVAWLGYVNALGEGEAGHLLLPSLDSAVLGAVAVDGATQLAPMAPPVWVESPALQALARGAWPLSEGQAREKALRLQAWYREAARFEVGLPVTLPGGEEKDEGIALVRDVVTARVGDEAQRAAARKGLATRLKKRPAAWVEVWCRVGLGRSLLREAGRDEQLLGVNELLEVAARLERVNPYLTGVALAEAAAALHRLGDVPGATRVRSEMLERFSGHPAQEWGALRSWSPAAPAAVGEGGNKGGST
jgi:hypothetical protein